MLHCVVTKATPSASLTRAIGNASMTPPIRRKAAGAKQARFRFSEHAFCPVLLMNADELAAAEDIAAADVPHADEGKRMTELERIRHSCAHVLATAILRIWPDAQFAAGPPVENGFYYDVELSHRIAPEDFAKIEEEMKKEVKANHTFEKIVVPRQQALEDATKGRLAGLSERGTPSKFKLDIVQNIPENEPISYYKNGDFLDLCAGPHVMRTGNIGAFKLTHVASAYYKGDERNPQLQRIYGTAFKNKTELEAYFKMLEEAKKRDHRKIGQEMGLFTFDEDVGPGLPLWLPRGTVLIEELENLAKETEFAGGYQRVRTPHLARENMYLTSGHLPYYAESMFPPMELRTATPEYVAYCQRIETNSGKITALVRPLALAAGQLDDPQSIGNFGWDLVRRGE